ncbi:hypothetical protein PHYSODRAFT_494901 [Phytophthora sojae]|uniref:Uncharacterized protein n=1 Tax=Phytophthora sojae (strain P6497) TaxID=1094619 RepID=G4Z2S2_PHYSP|nr:hypothetical protein PHYSODRAFT_494901 [Phytophthora sojae]EGZ22197.1 hypothetical protein PHYSODRAFT_494901 [Phytophthora sojae]|eukprot:XP_009524914.1 hypothetical protein PHYSODRAFT_494901 [Phytophthora sojae]
MAMRLQKDNNWGEGTLEASRTSVVEAEEGAPLVITPSTNLSKTALVRQFDRGDVIPFFFAMPHANASSRAGDAATELANCLERMLQRERTGIFEPPPGKTALLILDDLHLATPAETSTARPLYPSVYAYLRSVQEHGKVYRGASCLPISFFPLFAPSCGLEELHHIFGHILHAHWGLGTSSMSATLPTAVRYALPLVIAATTVIWDRLRATFKYHLQDLARVYEGLGGVSPSTLSDVETLLRLWTHECSRTLREPSMGLCGPRQDNDVTGEISRMRSQISQITQRRASARAIKASSDDNASPATLLTLFAARSAGSPSRAPRPSQQYNSLQEQQHRAAMMGGLWAFSGSSSRPSWIYAEISYEDDMEAVSTASVQPYYRDLRTFSSCTMTLKPTKATALPRDVPPVPFKLVRTRLSCILFQATETSELLLCRLKQ